VKEKNFFKKEKVLPSLSRTHWLSNWCS